MCRVTEVSNAYSDLAMIETKRKIKRSTLLGMLMRCDPTELEELRRDASNKNKKLLIRHLDIAEYLKSKGVLPKGAKVVLE